MTASAPQNGDIVVHEEQRGGTFVYALRTVPGPEQVIIATYERAVEQALTFAKHERVRVWVETDGDFQLLKNVGVAAFT